MFVENFLTMNDISVLPSRDGKGEKFWRNKKMKIKNSLMALFIVAILTVATISVIKSEEAGDNSETGVGEGVNIDPALTGIGINEIWGMTTEPGISTEGLGLPTQLYSKTLNGGYTTGGVGMRNRGWGTILIRDIPKGSSIDRAYLFWSVIGPAGVTTPPNNYSQGKFKGISIIGTLMGSSATPCWGGQKIFGYYANVTSSVSGNNQYHLEKFISGNTWGDDPWQTPTIYPLIEGASLVVVYKNSKYPSTTIKIKRGVDTLPGSGGSTTNFTFSAKTKPVAITTFIVADGQSNGGESVKFNGVEMPVTFCDGIDRQNGINFIYANLQDTNTALVKVAPGATMAKATINATGDCITWLAQVFAIFEGNVDTDGDALKDAWEIYGYDYNGDGIVDVNLPAMGANPFHKDIFVEVDYMARDPVYDPVSSHKPDPKVVATSISTFANAPSANNPDGLPGINIHVEVDDQIPHDVDLNPVWTEFDALKATWFPAARQDTHHYCIFAHKFSGGTSSGISRGIPASDFVVSLGGWPSNPGTPDEQTGTFIHELGHNLGLTHGGTDHVNYKPNYISIMNYFFQMSGLYYNGGWGHYDYQRISPYTLNENLLNESNGVGNSAAGYGTRWYSPPSCTVRTTTINKPIDWNWNGVISTGVSVDINCDGVKGVLTSQNNWLNIVYNGGSVGGVAAGIILTPEKMPTDLTYEEYLRFIG